MSGIPTPPYKDLEQIQRLVGAFEACTLPPAQFTHQAHMTVALWYLAHLPAEAAAERMRAGLLHLLAHHGIAQSKYNETITLFWMKLLGHMLDVDGAQKSLLELTNETVASFGSMRFVFSHYSKELAFSDTARSQWVEPDLLPIPF